MTKICAWCKKDLGTVEGPEEGVTHGICPDCKEVLSATNQEYIYTRCPSCRYSFPKYYALCPSCGTFNKEG